MTTALHTRQAPRAGSGTSTRIRRVVPGLLTDLGTLVGSLLAASLVIFLALHLLPGDQAVIVGGMDASGAQLAEIRRELGLDRPVIVQYLDWIGGAVTGDLGVSPFDHRSIAAELGEKLQVTLPLGLLALLLSLLIAVPFGMLAAAGRDSLPGRAISASSQVGLAVPTFVMGLVLVRTISLRWGLLPVQGFPADRWADPSAALRSLLLPAVAIAIPQGAVLLRFVRSATIDVLQQDWVRTGRAQGWSLAAVMLRQGLRNASLPLMAVIGLELAGLLMGSVIVERVFVLPGVGGMLLQDVGNRDIAKVQGTLLVLTAIIMCLTVALNILYRVLDPRLKGSS